MGDPFQELTSIRHFRRSSLHVKSPCAAMTYLRFKTMQIVYSRSASASALVKLRVESTWRSGTVTVAPKRTRWTPHPRWKTCSCACVTRLARWRGAAKILRRWSTSWSASWMKCRRWNASEVSQTVSRGAHGFRIPGQASFTARPISRGHRCSPTVELVSLRRYFQARLADPPNATPALDRLAVPRCATQQLIHILLLGPRAVEDRPRRLLRTSRPLRGLLEIRKGGSSTGCSPSPIHRVPRCRGYLPLLGRIHHRVRL